ncbi:MAG: N-acetylmuramoyl-L-alanine amidase [Peptococcaceae bacterium]|nr:MAG: N-acetylmuramoyl-L-alanine amidase [Peptococcaceae bacterium]
MLVVLDPGHGGRDPGATGPGGTREKDVVLPIAKKLAEILTSAGIKVKLTRTDDSDVGLAERVKISNAAGADIFISIHANAFTNPQAKGMEVWTARGQGAADPIAESIADALITVFPDLVFRADVSDGDKDKEAGFYVLRWTDAPAVLVELAFISNPAEEALLKMPDYQAKAAGAIANGVLKHLGIEPEAPVELETLPAWVVRARAWAREAGISDGTRPLEPAKRAEVWEMLRQLCIITAQAGNNRLN